MRGLRIIEPRTTRIVEVRDEIELLAHKTIEFLKIKPEIKKIFNEYLGRWEFIDCCDNPDYEELKKIPDLLCSVCNYIDDEVLPTVQDRIEEEEAEEALLAAAN